MSQFRKELSVDKEASEVLAYAKQYIHPDLEITLSADLTNMQLLHVNMLRFSRNFNLNIVDDLFIEFTIGHGTFRDLILTNRDRLEISFNLTFDKKSIKRKYKFILLNKYKDTNRSDNTKIDTDILDRQDIVIVKGQLIDPITLELKNKFIEGVYHDTDINTFFKRVFASNLNDITVLGKPVDLFINIFKPDNEKIYDNILVPYMKLVKCVNYIQTGDYGVYNGGIGLFISNMLNKEQHIYDIDIFPLHEVSRYELEDMRPKLLLINPSINDLGKNDLNFYYTHGVYKAIVSDVTFHDDNEKMKVGVGVLETYPESIMDDNPFLKDSSYLENKTITDLIYVDNANMKFKAKNSYNYVRLDDNLSDFSKFIDTEHDANLFKYYSKYNRHDSVVMTIKMAKVNPEMIFPGMSVKYIFNRNDKLVETNGVVQGVDFYYDFINKTNVTAIICAVKRLS